MPPLTWVWVDSQSESDRGTVTLINAEPRSLSARSARPPSQGSGLAASLAPRPWHEHRFSTSTEPQAPRMLDEPDGSPCPLNCLPAHAENAQYEQ